MASIRSEISITAPPEQVWSAARDVGALHSRLVPGFVIATQSEPGARVVTFGNGQVVRELIVDVDDRARRLVWSAVGTAMTHHNASLQISTENGGSRVVWIADLLPDELAPGVRVMMDQGLAVMKRAMERDESAG
jgi:carbon monoxide dehydrogenase subunit G